MTSGERLLGVDLARFVALAGMVLVHARSDLVLPPLEAQARAAGLSEAVAPAAPAVLELLQAVATNRARLLFLLLAGVGVALLAGRRRLRTTTLLRRAGFLSALGVVLLLLGWSDVVLLFYGVLFALAPALLGRASRTLVGVAVLVALTAVGALALDPDVVSDVTGALLVVGEAVPLFCLGIVVGRLDLRDGSVVRRVATCGALLAAPGLAVLTGTGGLDVTEVDAAWELAAATTSTSGLCLLVVAGCLVLTRAGAGRGTTALALTGGMPLTAYVGHALLFPVIAGRASLDLGPATVVAVAYLAGAVVFAVLWRRRYSTGPVEAALRQVSGPGGVSPRSGP